MIKTVLGALVGIAIILLGISVWYYYIISFSSTGGNNFLFGLSITQIGIVLYILFWTSRHADPYGLKAAQSGSTPEVDVLKRSEEIVKNWYEDKKSLEASTFVTVTPKETEQGE